MLELPAGVRGGVVSRRRPACLFGYRFVVFQRCLQVCRRSCCERDLALFPAPPRAQPVPRPCLGTGFPCVCVCVCERACEKEQGRANPAEACGAAWGCRRRSLQQEFCVVFDFTMQQIARSYGTLELTLPLPVSFGRLERRKDSFVPFNFLINRKTPRTISKSLVQSGKRLWSWTLEQGSVRLCRCSPSHDLEFALHFRRCNRLALLLVFLGNPSPNIILGLT